MIINEIKLINTKYSTTRKIVEIDSKVMLNWIEESNKSESKIETLLFQPQGERRRKEGGLRTNGFYKISDEKTPLISIITVVFNGDKFLEETILSVLNQTYDNVEYIIIDGGSTDGTLDLLQKYNHAIDYWISEKDNGMYDGINKGLVLSQGEILNFINSDDYFFDEHVLESVVNIFIKRNSDCYYGRSMIVNASGNKISLKKPLKFKKRYLKTLGLFFTQPTFFWKKSLMVKTGFIDTKYKIAADYDFIAKLLSNSKVIVRDNRVVSCFRVFGESFGDKNSQLAEIEFSKINSKFDFQFSMIVSLYDRLIQKIYQYVK